MLTSAGGILALLQDNPHVKADSRPEDVSLKIQLTQFALKKLDLVVDEFWAEISDSIQAIEEIYEDKLYPIEVRELAAVVASKVFYHLGSYEVSLDYALGAGNLFDVTSSSQYVETIIAKCIDIYTSKRLAFLESGEKVVDKRLEAIVDRMFDRCFEHGQYRQALGIAIETKRMDIFERAVTGKLSDEQVCDMLGYAFRVVMNLIQNRTYRGELLRTLVKLYRGLTTPDYVQMCQCLIFLDEPMAVADILERLSKGTEEDSLMAYQIAFDMYESATQQFLSRVLAAIKKTAPVPQGGQLVPQEGEESMETDETKEEKKEEQKEPELSTEEQELKTRVGKLSSILSGEKPIYLHLQFLIRNDKTDPLILKNTKDAVRVSICHTATVIANGFMHSGTTHDQFLRDNLDWLSRATNWAKLSATATLGVIHRGHEKESLSLMQSYLPKDSAGTSSGYAEGGGLYALGLIHANHGGEITEYLLGQVKEATSEQIKHGGCLGLGLAAMGTHRADVYEQLKFCLYQDDAVTGEAAGLAMGLCELGSKSAAAIEDMVAYAQETQHEKILRGLAVGISLVMYGRLEEADPLITSLSQDKDAILRRSGMYTIAMAYCGTGNNKAIRQLLHVAVSDVNDDVRRAAVTGLGFLLFKQPDHCPGVVQLLSESYNPHVRYGAAMALGIACSGTGNKEALALIEPMRNDPVNYVRQGALIASAMILVQQTEVTCPKVKEFRALYTKVINDKHEDVMAKFGAILAQGIIDAGGRNVTVSLQSRTGHTNMLGVVGMLVFTQYWYWFPLSHFLSLAFQPTAVIGLNKDLDMPVVQFKSAAKPSTYGYPAPLEEKKKEDKEKVATAILSITNKQKKKEAERKKKEDDKMEVDEKEEKKKEEKMEEDKKKDEEDKKKDEEIEEKKEEPLFEMLSNPARVMKAQLKVIHMEDGKYENVKELSIGGIIMLKNLSGEKEEIVEPMVVNKGEKDEDEGTEPEPPQPFQWTED
ncbi:26S proteasome non-ATPase regulatory subunit 1 [Eurytemora carolleeae]|nr:26S proteasome non-ATPase regulatory subunit 1 [Eurytemora carolleeae]|eukprot:XP_023322822.1 26S proteasome non-ATPase regulatory subunit 1-like [Eurytemora affinis]